MRIDLTQWSTDQRAAITHGGHDVLVSAGAGSGKTSALVERVVRKVVDDPGCDVTQLLVVTFTEAAASEMRERIVHRLNVLADAARWSNDDEARHHIEKQLTLMDLANISTLHSFCLDVVRRNFAVLDIEPGFKIIDPADGVILRSQVFRLLLEEALSHRSASFQACVARFAPDNVLNLEPLALRVYGYARSQPDPQGWLTGLASHYRLGEGGLGLRDLVWFPAFERWVTRMLDTALHHLAQGAAVAEPFEDLAAYASAMVEEATRVQSTRQALHSGEALETVGAMIAGIFTARPRAKEHEAKAQVQYHRTQAKKILDPVADVLTRGEASLLADVALLAPAIEGLVNLISEFMTAYFKAKQANGWLDFDDLEHLALEALNDPRTGEAVRLQSQFLELFVDEYQDTSPIQEAVLTAISRPTGNRFAVGDVKQSIYRFRMAEPNLFLDKYRRYRRFDECGHESDDVQWLAPSGEVIDLNTNYRSRAPVVSFVNFLFQQLFSDEFGGHAYDDGARMRPGAIYPVPDGQSSFVGHPVEVHLVERLTPDERVNVDEDATSDDNLDGSDPMASASEVTEADLSSAEREALLIGRRILELTGRLNVCPPEQIWDKQLKSYRPIQFRDIVVLMRSVQARMQPVLEVFRQLGIPAYGATATGFYDTIEVQWVMSALMAIDNPRRDIALATVLKSPIGGFRDEDLARIRTYRKGNFYEAVTAYAADKTEDGGTLPGRVGTFLKQFRRWRRLARRTSAAEFILSLLDETHLDDYVLGMESGDVRHANLESLIDQARTHDAAATDGVFGLVARIREGWRHDLDSGEARTLAESEDVVRITTIHQSKGLEYPVVFVADLGKQFNRGVDGMTCLLHPALGIAPVLVDDPTHRKWRTLPWYALQEVETREYLAEEARVLYVALTRARERLILVGSARNLAGFVRQAVAEGADTLTFRAHSLFAARTPLAWLIAGLTRHPTARSWLTQVGDLADVQLPAPPADLSLEDPSWLSVHVWNTMSGSKLPALSDLMAQRDRLNDAASQPSASTDEQTSSAREAVIGSLREAATELDTGSVHLVDDVPGKVSATDLRRMWSAQLLRQSRPGRRQQQGRFSPGAAERLLAVPTFVERAEPAPNAKGTAFHRVMMAIPLSTPPTIDAIDAALSALVDDGAISSVEQSAVDVREVAAFLSSPLGRRVTEAKRVMREQPFFSRIDIGVPGGANFVVVQGVIDCLAEEQAGWLIVDYKTDAVTTGQVDEKVTEYQAQISAYVAAVRPVCGDKPIEAILYFVKPGVAVTVNPVPLQRLFERD